MPPAFRVNGEIIIADEDALTDTDVTDMADSLMNDATEEVRAGMGVLHFAAAQRRRPGRALLPAQQPPGIEFSFLRRTDCHAGGIGSAGNLDELARKPNGLVLITGPTGAGKTTTLNYLVDLINSERRCKIVTIEDPIEFVHGNKRAIVVQQEVLTDVHLLIAP